MLCSITDKYNEVWSKEEQEKELDVFFYNKLWEIAHKYDLSICTK